MWRFVGDQKGLEPLPGIPLEASDEDFEAAVKAYEASFGDETAGSVKTSGLYEHVKDKTTRGGSPSPQPAEEAS